MCTSFGLISPGSTRCSTSAIVTRPHIAASGLKLRAASRKTRLPCRSPFQARTSPKSATMARSSTYSSPSNTCVGLGGLASATLPSPSYFHGMPPSATWVPTPVRVKNAAIPEPPARIRSASVPCGVSSTSSSPARYCLANSLFSPT